jgi:hypothetical protein
MTFMVCPTGKQQFAGRAMGSSRSDQEELAAPIAFSA